jgi:dihydroneopterin aldolase/2-amino-4-hydroxy-6-hydroxymethyldihydropteridine diphosphokinase
MRQKRDDETMTFEVAPFSRYGVQLDQIAVHGVRATGHHGVLTTERESGQVFLADVVVHVSTHAAAITDDLDKTVNYSDLADRVAEVLAGDPAELLETVAEHIALAALNFDGVECVDVRVHKPQAPLHVEFGDVTVTIRRDVRTADLTADKRIGSSSGLPDDPLDPGAAPRVRDVLDERPLQPVPALLALGGNIGDVEGTLRHAIHDLDRISGIEVRSTGPLVRSRPQGGPEQPDYLNTVIRIHTALSPRELLGACHGIELVHGRQRSVANAPRTLDIDIVDFNGMDVAFADLTLPHPRARERAFVLVPWSAMEPDATLAGVGRVAEVAAGLPEGVTVVDAAWSGRAAPPPPSPDQS